MVEQIICGGLCAQTLEVPMADGSREHVQQLDMARRVIAIVELVA